MTNRAFPGLDSLPDSGLFLFHDHSVRTVLLTAVLSHSGRPSDMAPAGCLRSTPLSFGEGGAHEVCAAACLDGRQAAAQLGLPPAAEAWDSEAIILWGQQWSVAVCMTRQRRQGSEPVGGRWMQGRVKHFQSAVAGMPDLLQMPNDDAAWCRKQADEECALTECLP